jgi:hypothetical protein
VLLTELAPPRVPHPPIIAKPSAIEFFVRSGLVTGWLKSFFFLIWANDFSDKKAVVYRTSQGRVHFHLGPVESVLGSEIPDAVPSWAIFPCHDLSLSVECEALIMRQGVVWFRVSWTRRMRSFIGCLAS